MISSLMVKNLAEAKKYVNKIKKGLIKNSFTNRDCADSLKIFAEAKDEERFKIVGDFMAQFISKVKAGGLRFFKKEPLAFIECLLMIVDYGDKVNYAMYQTYRGIKVKRPPIGKTQRFFQKIYGSHFFKKKTK